MSQKRLSMRKIEEKLRLKFQKGLTHLEIARSCAVSAATVSDYVLRARLAGLS
jgi:DNA-binding transcriptional regulator LsrR (DeoR family)